jgi:hypothetical protein
MYTLGTAAAAAGIAKSTDADRLFGDSWIFGIGLAVFSMAQIGRLAGEDHSHATMMRGILTRSKIEDSLVAERTSESMAAST